MERDPRAFLWDVQQACSRIGRFVQGKNREAYLSDELTRSAVERQLDLPVLKLCVDGLLARLDNGTPR